MFDIPDFRRVEEWTTIADFQGSHQAPSALIRHLPAGSLPSTVPTPSNPATLLSYYIIPEGTTNVWHKYQLHLFPNHLAQSFTVHTHTIACTSFDKEHVSYRATGLFDGNIVGDIWEGKWEGKSRYCAWISMLRWQDVKPKAVVEGGVTRPKCRMFALDLPTRTPCDMVPFIPWSEVWSGHGPVSFALCPASASAAVLWSETDPATGSYWFWVRHYSFR